MTGVSTTLTRLLVSLLMGLSAMESQAVSLCRAWTRSLPRNDQGLLILGLNSERPTAATLAEVFAMQVRQGETARRFWQQHSPGDRIVGLELRNIKLLNEGILGTSQTEQFLEVFKIRLHEHLSNYYPGRGIIFTNFKRIFVWFPASAEVFKEQILETVIRRVADDVAFLHTKEGQAFDWLSFLKQNVQVSDGTTQVIASINLSLQNSSRIPRAARANEVSFSRFASDVRSQLSRRLRDRNLDMDELLSQMRRASAPGAKPNQLAEWLREVGLGGLHELAQTYLDILRAAEYLPYSDAFQIPSSLAEFVEFRKTEPFGRWRTSWNVERRVFKQNSANAEYAFVTDVQGLGLTGLRLLDRWVLQGARMDELQRVFWGTTAALEQRIVEVKQELTDAVAGGGPRPEIHVYMSGDDAIWSISKLNDQQYRRAIEFLEMLGSRSVRQRAQGIEFEIKYHVSRLVKIQREATLFDQAIEDAIAQARTTLKEPNH